MSTATLDEPEETQPGPAPTPAKQDGVSGDSSTSGADIITFVLKFFEDASSGTLVACFVGLGSATILVLGRLGLLLIGTIAGVVLHASWERSRGSAVRHKVVGIGQTVSLGDSNVVASQRQLNGRWGKSTKNGSELSSQDVRGILATTNTLDYSNLSPETGAALASLTDAVIRDYIRFRAPWHD